MLQHVGSFLRAVTGNLVRLKLDELFYKIFMYKSYRTPQEKFLSTDYMEQYSFVEGNVSKIGMSINDICALLCSGISSVIGTMILFWQNEPWLLLYTLIISISALFLNKYTSKKEYELNKTQIKNQREHNYYKGILTDKNYGKELRIYKVQAHIVSIWNKLHEELRLERLTLELKHIKLRNIYTIVKTALRIVAMAFLLVGVINKRYDLGTFVMLFGLVDICSNQINSLAYQVMSGVYKNMQYLNDYYDFISPITNAEIMSIRKGEEERLTEQEFVSLEAKHVSFTYPQKKMPAVNDVCFKLNKGEIVSILGYNGSGKTTFAKLLTGALSPTHGQILFNGEPVTRENCYAKYFSFGILLQEYSRFSVSIREYVGLGSIKQMQDDALVQSALQKANAVKLIDTYNERERTILGKAYDENGVDLSGGEWQRLAIASAYMGEPPVYVLDEPTASIDPLLEAEMLSQFRKNIDGKTAILISHRIGFARLADRIILMENGRIIESGSHEELLSANGKYAKMFNEQKSLYEAGLSYEK